MIIAKFVSQIRIADNVVMAIILKLNLIKEFVRNAQSQVAKNAKIINAHLVRMVIIKHLVIVGYVLIIVSCVVILILV